MRKTKIWRTFVWESMKEVCLLMYLLYHASPYSINGKFLLMAADCLLTLFCMGYVYRMERLPLHYFSVSILCGIAS